MATPMLNAIRASNPNSHITWLVDSAYQEVLTNHPLIDEIYSLDSGSWRRLRRRGNIVAWIRRTKELHAEMKSRNFDAVINCQAEDWWSYFLCSAPIKIGLFHWPPLPIFSRLYNVAIPKPKKAGLHNTDQFLQATTALGFEPASKRMSVGKTPEEEQFLTNFANEHSLSAERMKVVIAPFSTSANRSITAGLMSRVIEWLSKCYRAQIILTCGPQELERAKALVSDSAIESPVIIAGKTSLREYIALIRAADLVITGDSSPMHLAGAVGTPFVALFGPTPAEERTPLESRGVTLHKPLACAPCDLPTCANANFQLCMKLIELNDVQAAITSVLREPAGSID